MKRRAILGAGAQIVYDGGSAVDELAISLGVDVVIHVQTGGDHMEELSERFIWVRDWLVIWINLQ